MRQLRFAFRTLFKAPFVTGVAILSLALGLGANAAIFSLFNQLLLRPLPVEAPLELVNLSAPGPKPGNQAEPGVGSLSFYVRTAGDTTAFLVNIPRVVARLDPNLPVQNLRTLEAQVRENVFLDRLLSVLSAAFASLATILAAVGLYGVLAYTVAQRTREIGVRMALGAAPGRVRGMILRQVGVMTLVGGAIGLTVSVWLGRVAQSLLFELEGSDLTVFAASAAVLTLVALAAGFVPALRASRVEPMRALRYE